MPGATPIYGIPYPEMSDPMDPSSFAATATAIDSVLATTDALLDARMRYPALSLSLSTAGPLASGVNTQASFTTENYDTHNMWSATFPTLIFCRLPGVYAYTVASGQISGYVSRVYTQFGIQINAVAWELDRRYPSLASSDEITFSGVFPLQLDDQVTMTYLFSGVGNATNIVADLTLEFVCPLT